MKILSILLGIVGIACFVRYKYLVSILSDAYTSEFQKKFGSIRDWKNPRYQLVYKTVVFMGGVILLIIALGMFFGPVTLVQGG